MEDFYDAKILKVDDQMIGLFGVFDDHGGSRAAEYLKHHLFDNLIKHPQFATDTKLALTETYQQTDSEFLKEESSMYRDDGSTASTAVLVGDRLYVANVGDSRAVIMKAGEGDYTVMLPILDVCWIASHKCSTRFSDMEKYYFITCVMLVDIILLKSKPI